MKYFLLITGFFLLSFAVPKDISGKYAKPNNTGSINLDKAGTFFIQQAGAGGAFESKGKWVLKKDTVVFSNIQDHTVGDPWKKKTFTLKLLHRNDSLISFSYKEGLIQVNTKEGYKKLKGKPKS